jgi:hypothetical protein
MDSMNKFYALPGDLAVLPRWQKVYAHPYDTAFATSTFKPRTAIVLASLDNPVQAVNADRSSAIASNKAGISDALWRSINALDVWLYILLDDGLLGWAQAIHLKPAATWDMYKATSR